MEKEKKRQADTRKKESQRLVAAAVAEELQQEQGASSVDKVRLLWQWTLVSELYTISTASLLGDIQSAAPRKLVNHSILEYTVYSIQFIEKGPVTEFHTGIFFRGGGENDTH